MERSGSLFDPEFPTYVRAVIVFGVLLCVLWLVGAKFEFAKKMGWIKFRRKGQYKQCLILILKQPCKNRPHNAMIMVKFIFLDR